MQGRDLAIPPPEGKEEQCSRRKAMLLQPLQGIDEHGGTHLELPRCRKPGFLLTLLMKF